MNINDALKGIDVLYLDTAPFIYYTENRAVYIDKMQTVFQQVHQGQIQIITSAVTLPETLMKPLENKDTQLVNQYRTMFYQTQGITVAAISPTMGDTAADLRSRYNIRTPDALHLATAIESGCDAFLTNDIGLKRVSEITILILDELDAPPST